MVVARRVVPIRSSKHANPASLFAVLAHVAPAILKLLADDMAHDKAFVAQALAGRHVEDDIELRLIRLAATGQMEEVDRKHWLVTTGA